MRKKYAVLWTWKQYDIVPTKKRGIQKMKAWKRWYIRHNWEVRGSQDEGYMAVKDDIDFLYEWNQARLDNPPKSVHAIGLREVTPEQVKYLDGDR